MKKMLAMLLAALLLFASCALAEGAFTNKPIDDADYALGTTFGALRKEMRIPGISFDYVPHSPRFLADVNPYMASWLGESQTPLCFSVTGMQPQKVGGFEGQPELRYIYPAPGAPENDAQLYGVAYRFYDWDVDVKTACEKLTVKLKKEYGEPYYEGKVISEALGEPEFPASSLEGYYQSEEGMNPSYKVWRSSANGCMAVLKYYEEGSMRRLELVYADEKADALLGVGVRDDNLTGL